jgi:hypothetical protein
MPPTTERAAETRQEVKTSAQVVSAGSIAEALGGIGAGVLAIIGLAGTFPFWLTAVAVIVMGAALLLQGLSVAGRFYALSEESAAGTAGEVEMGSGAGAAVLGGAAGIVLGILALLDVFPLVLLPVAAIVFGGCLLLSCGAGMELNSLNFRRTWPQYRNTRARVLADVVSAANGVQVLVGLAGVVLGIIALINPYFPLTLTLVAVLVMACSLLLSGGALSGRMIGLINRF